MRNFSVNFICRLEDIHPFVYVEILQMNRNNFVFLAEDHPPDPTHLS